MLVLGLGMLAGPERAMAARAVGIDVSDYQSSSINWSTLKNTYSIVFAWAKISEGGSSAGGSHFTTYAANAKAAGVLIGPYHYARYDLNPGTSGATAEANYFWSVAKNYVKGGGFYIQPMLDVEASFTGQTKTTLSQWVNQWCLTVSNSAAAAGVPGVKPCIYCSSSHAATYLDSTVTQWNTDIADWPYAHASALASAQAASYPPAGISPWTPSTNWKFWQYDDQNAAQAITTGDGDIYNGTLAQLLASPLVIGGTPPTITTQPASQTASAGANVSFNVVASGATPFSYQWRFNGGNISGATASSYTRNNVQTANSGSYSVVVTNIYGSATSANGVLTVHTPPAITAQPASVNTGLGLTVHFSVAVTGDAPLSYQWRLNDGNLTGATTSALTIANAQVTNSGTYAVVITNLYGTVTSANALLAVLDPFITNQPQNLTVAEGAPAAFSVGAVGTAPLTYSWSKAGVPMADGGNISGSGTPTLTVANVQVSDASTYSVTVSNANGSILSSNAILLAAFAPSIVTQPASQQVPAASIVSLSVAVVGPGPITYQWRKDTTNLANGGDISGVATASLSISNVQAGDMGIYSVAVSNAYGGVISSNAQVTVWPLAGWGRNDYIQADVPAGLTNVTAIAAGVEHNLALRSDGTVAAWGAGKTNSGVIPNNGQSLVPSGLTNVAAIAAGFYHSLALLTDGTVAAWGAGTSNTGVSPQNGQCMIPAGLSNVTAVAAGGYHSLALLPDGTVAVWGDNSRGQTNLPAGLANVVGLAASRYHSLALKADGTVVAWGAGTNNTGVLPDYGQSVVPGDLSNVVAVAAGGYHNLALKCDGTVVAWGYNASGQSNVPAGLSNVVAVSGGYLYSTALKSDGTVVVWGDSSYGQTTVPTGLANVAQIAAGGFHDLVLESDGRPSLTVQPVGQTAAAGATVRLQAMAVGNQPLSYQWQMNGTNIPGATATALSLANVQFDDAGAYSLTVSNAVGSAASANALLTVLSPPVISQQPSDQMAIVGEPVNFSVIAAGSAPVGYQWQLNSADIAGATQSAYSLASAQPTNAGTYSVVVSNAYGVAASSNAVLTVLLPPNITAQPSNQTAVAGATVSFTVQADSAAQLHYQWYLYQTNALAQGDTATLSLTNVQPAQAGDYSVVVDNIAGSVTSAVATLTVIVPSAILSAPAYGAEGAFGFNVTGAAGNNYVISTSTNLVDWIPLETNTSPFTFTDTNAVSVPSQFYRVQPWP